MISLLRAVKNQIQTILFRKITYYIALQEIKPDRHLNERFWNIPNTLSLYRLLVFPLILWLIITGRQDLFAIFIAISLFTDFLDGIIARIFRQQTRIGAKLDSWADTGTFICAFIAIWLFKWDLIKPHAWIWWLFLAAWIFSYLVVLIKFKGLIGLHTWLFKITGYLQGVFLVCLFVFDFYPWLFYLSLGVGIIACIEEIIIILLIRRPISNVKGLYWVLQQIDR